MYVAERIRKLNQANKEYAYKLTTYSDKKLNLKPTQEDALIISIYEQGRIQGYLESLQDTGVINKYDLKVLFNHYNMDRKFGK